MLAGGAGLPHDPEPDLAGNALLIEDHLAHDKAQQALALGRGSGPLYLTPDCASRRLARPALRRADGERRSRMPSTTSSALSESSSAVVKACRSSSGNVS